MTGVGGQALRDLLDDIDELADNESKRQKRNESVERIQITWRDGAYHVSKPAWNGGEVVQAEDYDRLYCNDLRLRRVIAALAKRTEGEARALVEVISCHLGFGHACDLKETADV